MVRCGKKKLNWKFDFRFMLFALSFRLMFCNAVSKEGCDRNESNSKMKLHFLSNEVSDLFYLNFI